MSTLMAQRSGIVEKLSPPEMPVTVSDARGDS
jgi:hypothetical protein